MTLLGSTPVISWFGFGRIAPLPVDILARGVASITLERSRSKTVYYAGDLRKRSAARTLRRTPSAQPQRTLSSPRHPIELLDEDAPFGWTPPERDE
jgi:hypothetical protein